MKQRNCIRLLIPLVLVGILAFFPAEGAQGEITTSQPLAFGSFVPGSMAGSLTVDTNGNIDSFSSLEYVQGDVQEARFDVSSDSNTDYTIDLPNNNTVELTDESGSMYVNDFTSNPSGSGTLDGGSQTLYVGATLEVGGGQSTGSYTGSFEVTVTFE